MKIGLSRALAQKLGNLSLLCTLALTFAVYSQKEELSQPALPPIEAIDLSGFEDPAAQQEIVTLPPEPIKTTEGEEKIGLTMNFPLIGPVTLYSEVDPTTKASVLRAKVEKAEIYIPDKSNPAVIINNLNVVMKEGKSPSLTADATVFGKKATLELVQLTPSSKIQTQAQPTAVQGPQGKTFSKLSLPIELAHFRITFQDKPTLTLMPGKSIALSYADLIIEKNKPITISAAISMFGLPQPVMCDFLFSKQVVGVKFSLAKVTFGELIKPLSTSPFAHIMLEKAEFQTSKALQAPAATQQAEAPTQENAGDTSFNATVNFSSLTLPELSKLGVKLDSLSAHATLTKEQGFSLSAGLIINNLPILGGVAGATFEFDSALAVKAKIAKEAAAKARSAPEAAKEQRAQEQAVAEQAAAEKEGGILVLTGEAKPTIPAIGTLTCSLSSLYSPGKGIAFTGEITQPVPYAGVQLEKANITLDPTAETLTMVGDLDVKGVELKGSLIYNAKAKAEAEGGKAGEKQLEFTAQLATPAFKPFENVKGMPDFARNVTLGKTDTKVEITKIGTTTSVNFASKAEILNVPASLSVEYIKKQAESGFLLKASMPENWAAIMKLPDGSSLPKVVQEFAGKLPNPNLVISSLDDVKVNLAAAKEAETKAKEAAAALVSKGVNLGGTFKMPEKLASVLKIKGEPEFTIIAVFNPAQLESTFFKVALPQGIEPEQGPENYPRFSFGPLAFEVQPFTLTPQVMLSASVDVVPTKNDQVLRFGGGIAIGTKNPLELSLGLKGTWNNPFGFNGFMVENVAGAIGISPTPPLISSIGIQGTMALDPIKPMSLWLYINRMNGDVAVQGKIEQLFLVELVQAFAYRIGGIGKEIPIDKLPMLGVKDVFVSFAPKPVTIPAMGPLPARPVPMGLVLKGELDVLDKKAFVDIEVAPTFGVRALGCMSRLDFGPLHITKSAKETTTASTLRPEECKEMAEGPIVDIELNKEKQSILVSGRLDLEDIFTQDSFLAISKDGVHFDFETAIGPKDAGFTAEVKGDTAGKITDLNTANFTLEIDFKQNFVKRLQQVVTQGITLAQGELDKALTGLQNQINSFDSLITEASTGVKGLEDALKSIEAKLHQAEAAVSALDQEMSRLQQEYHDTPWYNAPKLTELGLKMGVNKGERLAASEGIPVLEKALEIARSALEEGVRKKGVEGLRQAKETLIGDLAKLKEGNKILAQVSKQEIQNLIVINRVNFKGSLQEIARGKLPRLTIDLTIDKKPQQIVFTGEFTLKDLESIGTSMKTVAQKVISNVTTIPIKF
jgi:hypothetical protein